MFSKIIITLVTLLISLSSFAAEGSKAQEALTYVKEKFNFAYHGEYNFSHNDNNKLKDFDHLHNPSLTYKPLENWKFNASAEFKYTDHEADAYPNRFYRALYTITRDNVLTEKNNGIDLSVGVARRVFDRQANPNTYGNSRVFANIGHSLPGGLGKNSAGLLTQYLFNDPKHSSAATWKHALELIPSISLDFNDKFSFSFMDDFNIYTPVYENTARKIQFSHESYTSFYYKLNDKLTPYFQFHYLHNDDFANKFSDSLVLKLGSSYTVNSKVTVGAEFTFMALENSDNKTFSDKYKHFDLMFVLDIAI